MRTHHETPEALELLADILPPYPTIRREYERAEVIWELAKGSCERQLIDAVRAALEPWDKESDAKVRVLGLVYWFTPLKVAILSEITGIRAGLIADIARKTVVVGRCVSCGSPLKISRSTTSRDLGFDRECQECREKRWANQNVVKDAERQAERDETQRLRELPYAEYLLTDHWQAMRIRALKRAHGRCQLCDTGNVELHVHHRNYDNIGCEDIYRDLIVLCKPCHTKFHDKLPEGPNG